jgi:hypothetical protein
MKKLILLYTLLLLSFTATVFGDPNDSHVGIVTGGQSIEELKSILSKAQSQYTKPEEMDVLMIKVRQYQKNPLPDQDSIMLDIYQSITSAYVTASHYKQAYQVFNSYLAYKENMLAMDKSTAINKATNYIGERSRNDQDELVSLKNQLVGLNSDNDSLSKRTVLFKGYFSLILLVLSIVFAVILVGYGIKVFNLKSRLYHNRSTIKNIHRLALTGRYEEGVRNALQASIKSVQAELAELKTAKH